MLQDELALQYKYKKLPSELSDKVRNQYLSEIPKCLNINGDSEFELKTANGTIISKGYERIVIGDYGAFIEFNRNQVIDENICIQKGQEYRINDEKYSKNVKYFWLTAKDSSCIKIYLQQKTVSYADYKPNMYYVSPFEVF
jgi:hypothetical protein